MSPEERKQAFVSRDIPKIVSAFDSHCESVVGCDYCPYNRSESCILAWYFAEFSKIETSINQTSTSGAAIVSA